MKWLLASWTPALVGIGALGSLVFAYGCSSKNESSDFCGQYGCTDEDNGRDSGKRSGSGETEEEPSLQSPETPETEEDASSTATACEQLQKCCDTLTTTHGTCIGIVSTKDEALCTKGVATCGTNNGAGLASLVSEARPCTELGACCDQIRASNSDPSVCEGAVIKADETACGKAYDGYKTFGPCL